MVQLTELVNYTNSLLAVDRFSDYCPNGLQVEGRAEVRRLVCGVTACQALVDAAVAAKADALLVHHGYFWKGEAAAITGIKMRRIKALLDAEISLLAWHLPLDAHPQLGNNAQLGQRLGLLTTGLFPVQDKAAVGLQGQLAEPQSADSFAARIESVLGRQPLYFAPNARLIKTIAWCSGGAQSYIEDAADAGVDAYLSGEVSEQTFHLARERDIHFFAVGHHASERYGVQALAKHLTQKFDFKSEFIDILNPV
ncbi:GTP cyclohydrolase 1 type 2 homolog YbgI [hydrothermal vent metagenome]|uniref:GTP cyclohydrolase 1 type 2 homolog YbgI n=1 Tax=hydrothermal vent metagenome TaxID=652676 RepID=A0A3B1BC91_9ZZZZ